MTWNSRRLQTGRQSAGGAGGAAFSGTNNVENLAKRIIRPNFYFLRICLDGITENYGKKAFNVQVTDLTNPNRPSHWYTDLGTQLDGHLLFRQTALRTKSKVSTKTVISPSHDFYWVQHPAELYGHAIRIEVFEQVGDLQRILIDRCAYFGKFDPAVIAEANKLQTALARGQKEKKERPRTAPAVRHRSSDINRINSVHRQVVYKNVKEKAKLELAGGTKTQIAKFEHQNYQSSINSNRRENNDDEKKKVVGIVEKFDWNVKRNQDCHRSRLAGKLLVGMKMSILLLVNPEGRAQDNKFRQHASQSSQLRRYSQATSKPILKA